MMKKILALVLAACMLLSLAACGSSGNTEEEEEILSLVGNWEEEETGDSYQAGFITEDSITIYWMSVDEDGNTSASLYWAGTYEAPTEDTDSWSWDSVNDTDQTGSALLASDSETKTFTYEDGVLSYAVTLLGTTNIYELVSTDTDYSIYDTGSSSSDDSESEEAETEEAETTEETETVEAVAGEEAAEESEAVEESTEAEADASSSEEATIEEQVLFNQDNIVITATGLTYSSYEVDVGLLIENNSDTAVTVQIRNGSVNGYMIDYGMSCDVAAGMKANDSMYFYLSDLELAGIGTIAEMEFSFHIFDSDTWDTILDSEQITLTTSAYGTYTQTYDDSGTVLYDANGFKIVAKGLSVDTFGTDLVVYIENNSTQDVTMQVRDTSVNGYMVDPVFSSDILAGKKVVATMDFYNSSLEENGITDITTISTYFHIFDLDTWDTIIDTDPVTINF